MPIYTINRTLYQDTFGTNIGKALKKARCVFSYTASFPLYSKALIESGAYSSGAQTLASAQTVYTHVLKTANCSDLPCLQAMDAEALYEICSSPKFTPTADGCKFSPTVDGCVRENPFSVFVFDPFGPRSDHKNVG